MNNVTRITRKKCFRKLTEIEFRCREEKAKRTRKRAKIFMNNTLVYIKKNFVKLTKLFLVYHSDKCCK